jgi:hypothetical protein
LAKILSPWRVRSRTLPSLAERRRPSFSQGSGAFRVSTVSFRAPCVRCVHVRRVRRLQCGQAEVAAAHQVGREGLTLLMWGQAGLVWARHDMNRDVCAAPEGDDGLPAVANEAVGGRAASATAIEAQSTFGNTVSTVAASRSRATSMGILSKKRPGWRGRSDRRLNSVPDPVPQRLRAPI